MSERIFKFELTETEGNLIMNALGQRPYAEVEALIGKIRVQATVQIREQNLEENKTSEEA